MEKKEVAQVKFDSKKPTMLNLKLLRDWVIWQFPKKTAKGFCGGVHPPLEKFGWIPAVVYPEKNEAQVHGHLSKTFETPELAAEYCLGLSAN